MRAARLLPCLAGVAACVPIGVAERGGSPVETDDLPAVPGDLALNPHNLIANATFGNGSALPWTSSFTEPGRGEISVVDGALCLRVEQRGNNAYDAQLRHREMTIMAGHRYHISFRAFASQPTRVRVKVGMQGPPFAEYWIRDLTLDQTPKRFAGGFKKNPGDDAGAELSFHAGGKLAEGTTGPFTVCIDDVRLEDPQFNRVAKAKGEGEAKVLVNQLGYYPGLAKVAVVRSSAAQPLEWKLFSASGREVAYGKTEPAGLDRPSGDPVHVIDFSPFKIAGRYVLAAGDERSRPFDIGTGIYRKLKYDALAYYYHNRSGIAIAMPYAGDEQWARPAGHLSDKHVPCAEGSGCSYALDVSGGWYDAGDHGKYVVNGAVSAWTLLAMYERAHHLGKSTAAFADGTLNIPEKGNKVPDLLDEVRWELELLLKMQVPEGEPNAGLVHHKVHDEKWTALGLAPHEDAMKRFLYPVSTAATLDLAAVAAQAGRIWRPIDARFAARCVAAAEKAWVAANRHPDLFATEGGEGGGPYADKRVEDELYWAAAELAITTKRPEYRKYVQASPQYLEVRARLGEGEGEGLPSSMNWQEVAAFGSISLAVVPGALPAADQKRARDAVVAAADAYLAVLKHRGFRVPIDWGEANRAPWGSNSFLLNNLIVLALAADFTDAHKYANAVAAGMDYLLGRNAMDQSYVTGHGSKPLRNPHHRFWAKQANDKLPPPPPGAVSGGPNSGLQDPYVKAAQLSGCAPDKCFADHIESWSTNEVAINWNAPFAWVLFYLDEKGQAAKPAR